jgi:hypothetical protein
MYASQQWVFVNQWAMGACAGVLAAHSQSHWVMSEAAVPNMLESDQRMACREMGCSTFWVGYGVGWRGGVFE